MGVGLEQGERAFPPRKRRVARLADALTLSLNEQCHDWRKFPCDFDNPWVIG